MIYRILLFFLYIPFLFFVSFFWGKHIVFAQEEITQVQFQAHIDASDSVEVGRNIILSGKNSINTLGDIKTSYVWTLGDGIQSYQEEVVHIFTRPGVYHVRLLIEADDPVTRQRLSSEMTKEIFVYERAVVLLTDVASKRARISALVAAAEKENVYLRVLDTSEGARYKKTIGGLIEEHVELIKDASEVVLWSEKIAVLSSLNLLSGRVVFQNKNIVVISTGSLAILRDSLKGAFSLLVPQRMIFTRPEALDEFFTREDGQDSVELIATRGYDFEILTSEILHRRGVFELPSLGIQYLQRLGIGDDILLYLLLLGVIVTFITFLKLVVGLSSVGLRIPVVLTYLFVLTGWQLSLLFVVVLMLSTYFLKILIGRRYLLYTAKVAFIVLILAIVLLFLVSLIAYNEWYEFDTTSILMIIVTSVLMERMVGVESEEGFIPVFRTLTETLIMAFATYLFVSWGSFQLLLLAHPEVLLLFLILNLLMGRFTGLRLMEYFRFREVLRYTEEEE